MRTKIQGFVLFSVLVSGSLVATPPASAATTQISGVSFFDAAGECGPPPPEYADFTDFTMVITGDLDGCWYTKIEGAKDNGAPSGVYLETGEEVFVGTLEGEEEEEIGRASCRERV